MTLKRTVIGLGLAVMAFGIWTLTRAHAQGATCTVSTATGAAARSGLDSTCVKSLMSYSLGFVFVASGVIIAIIALTMIAQQERIDLHCELKAVPRTWGKRNYVTTSDGLDGLNGLEGLDGFEGPLKVVMAPRFSVETT
jgi:hypothetical protein